jgi:hypothetical protein
VLPLAQAQATAYQFYAFPLSIIGLDKNSLPWILSNYIQTCWDERPDSPVRFCHFMYDYADNPFFEHLSVTWDWVVRTGLRPLNFIEQQILDRSYIYCVVDEYRLPDRRASGRYHFVHDVLVHGVDRSTNMLSLYGYTKNLSLKSIQVTYNSFARAVASALSRGGESLPLLIYRPCRGEYALNTDLIIRTVTEYLESVDTSLHYTMATERWDRAYGLNTYTFLVDYFDSYRDGEAERDPRHVQVLKEHAELMMTRLRYQQRCISTESFQHLAHEQNLLLEAIEILRLRSIRAFVRDDRSRLAGAADAVLEIQATESRILREYLDVMLSGKSVTGRE